jgi:hypothetical protein
VAIDFVDSDDLALRRLAGDEVVFLAMWHQREVGTDVSNTERRRTVSAGWGRCMALRPV